METQVSKTTKACLKLIGFASSMLLTIFSGVFAMLSLSALVISIVEKDIFSVVACAAAGFVAWMMWDIRKDALV